VSLNGGGLREVPRILLKNEILKIKNAILKPWLPTHSTHLPPKSSSA
jgi:hypothetical protein